MALETPNRQHLTLTAFYAFEGALPPDNDNPATFILTAAEGIKSLAFPPQPDFVGSWEDGLMIELLEPVNSSESISYLSGWANNTDGQDLQGCTPWVGAPETGNDVVDDFAASNGNFMILFPEVFNQFGFGFMGLQITELAQVDDAEIPSLPIAGL